MYNFATESGKRKIRGTEGTINEATLIRDFFGSIEVLKYSFTSVPLCLSHVDGSVNSNPKSNFLNYVDLQLVSIPQSSIDCACN